MGAAAYAGIGAAEPRQPHCNYSQVCGNFTWLSSNNGMYFKMVLEEETGYAIVTGWPDYQSRKTSVAMPMQ